MVNGNKLKIEMHLVRQLLKWGTNHCRKVRTCSKRVARVKTLQESSKLDVEPQVFWAVAK